METCFNASASYVDSCLKPCLTFYQSQFLCVISLNDFEDFDDLGGLVDFDDLDDSDELGDLDLASLFVNPSYFESSDSKAFFPHRARFVPLSLRS